MLCPEVWNFKEPASEFHTEKGLLDEKDNCGAVDNFHFSHIVSLTIPGAIDPRSLLEVLAVLKEDNTYYKVKDLDLSELVQDNFLQAFIKEGALSALSVGTHLDIDNCFCLTSNKKLILSLTKETFQTLGLVGKLSHFCKRNQFKYVVKIDLCDSTKDKRRFIECLKKLKFDVIMNWEPPNEEVCPSSIAKYLHNLKYKVKSCNCSDVSEIFDKVKLPDVDFENCDVSDCQDYVEWLGMLALGADLSEKRDSYVNSYEAPAPTHPCAKVRYIQLTGFFTSKRMCMFFKALREYSKTSNVPWLALYVQGFSDSVVSWEERENHFYTNGDNCYVFFMNQNNYLCCTQKTSYKYYKTK